MACVARSRTLLHEQETAPEGDGCEEQRWGTAALPNSQTNFCDKGSERAVSTKDNGGDSRTPVPVSEICDSLGDARGIFRIRDVPH